MENKNEFDILIIGGGPGGLSSGLYAGRNLLKTAVIESGIVGGKILLTEKIENCLGFSNVTPSELKKRFYEHCLEFGAEFIKDEIIAVEFCNNVKRLVGKSGEEYFSKSVIIATGSGPKRLGVKGELEYIGKGVSYCAICDAPFFKEMEVVVVGSGDSAIEEALHLSKFARNVTIIVMHDENILDCNRKSKKVATDNRKISFAWNSEIKEIKGDENFVKSIVVENNKTGEKTEKEVDGVFIFIGNIPKTEIFAEAVELNQDGYIITNEFMQTNLEGVYAVGDVKEKGIRQIITAVADGAVAATFAEKYIGDNFNKN